jgi:chromosome segregation ATPase
MKTVAASGVSRTLRGTVLVAAGLIIGSLAAPGGLTAQQPDVLVSLLSEVKGLRAAMEQMASAGPRIQLALGRLQLQEQRVATLVRRLDDVRSQLREVEGAAQETARQIAQLEESLRESHPAPMVRELEGQLAAMKAQNGAATAAYQRLTVDEAAVAAEVATEQGRWTEINQRLEELERALTRPPR